MITYQNTIIIWRNNDVKHDGRERRGDSAGWKRKGRSHIWKIDYLLNGIIN
jgi:hypothetical protein